jgi:hypothetical protein
MRRARALSAPRRPSRECGCAYLTVPLAPCLFPMCDLFPLLSFPISHFDVRSCLRSHWGQPPSTSRLCESSKGAQPPSWPPYRMGWTRAPRRAIAWPVSLVRGILSALLPFFLRYLNRYTHRQTTREFSFSRTELWHPDVSPNPRVQTLLIRTPVSLPHRLDRRY